MTKAEVGRGAVVTSAVAETPVVALAVVGVTAEVSVEVTSTVEKTSVVEGALVTSIWSRPSEPSTVVVTGASSVTTDGEVCAGVTVGVDETIAVVVSMIELAVVSAIVTVISSDVEVVAAVSSLSLPDGSPAPVVTGISSVTGAAVEVVEKVVVTAAAGAIVVVTTIPSVVVETSSSSCSRPGDSPGTVVTSTSSVTTAAVVDSIAPPSTPEESLVIDAVEVIMSAVCVATDEMVPSTPSRPGLSIGAVVLTKTSSVMISGVVGAPQVHGALDE